MEYDRAIDNFSRVIELTPNAKDINKTYYNRGIAFHKKRDYDKALYDFTQALDTTPSSDKEMMYSIFKSRGNAYLMADNYDKAIKDYNDAVLLQPSQKKNQFLYHNLGWAWFNKGQYGNAINAFSEAIDLDPAYASAYFGRATVWHAREDNQRAIIDAKEAVRLDPGNQSYDDLLYRIREAL
jgi:tetratricopeptide (TPR) repeat protein